MEKDNNYTVLGSNERVEQPSTLDPNYIFGPEVEPKRSEVSQVVLDSNEMVEQPSTLDPNYIFGPEVEPKRPEVSKVVLDSNERVEQPSTLDPNYIFGPEVKPMNQSPYEEQSPVLTKIDSDEPAMPDAGYNNYSAYLESDGEIIQDMPENGLFDETYVGFVRDYADYYLISQDQGTKGYILRKCVPDKTSSESFQFYVFEDEKPEWINTELGQSVMATISNSGTPENNIWEPSENVNVFRCSDQTMFDELCAVRQRYPEAPLKEVVKADVTNANQATHGSK